MELSDLSDGRQEAAELALTYIGRTGFAVWREIEMILLRMGVGPGLARRASTDLEELGWIIKASPKLHLNMRLSLVRLSVEGIRRYEWKADLLHTESEWQRMIDGHNGDLNERHTLGVLALAWQARLRGHKVRLLPGHRGGGRWWVNPDLNISFERAHPLSKVDFEFETRPRNKLYKWRKWDRTLGGWGVCTFTEKQRESMGRELERAGIRHRPYMYSLEWLLKNPEAQLFF